MAEHSTTQCKDAHLTVYLAWPILAGLALGLVLGISVGGVVWLASGLEWRAAAGAAGIVFFATLGLATVAVFWYAAKEWAGPRGVLKERRTVEVIEPETPEPELRFIPMGGRPPPINASPALPSTQRLPEVGVIARVLDALSGQPKLPPTATYDTAAPSMEPSAPAWVKEMHDTIVTVWPTGSLSRRTFEGLWPGGEGKKRWQRYVNGTGSRHTQRGILDTWGVIAKTGARGSWEWTQGLDVIFGLDPDLERYARARATMVRRSPTTPGRTNGPQLAQGQTEPDRTNQTRAKG